MPDDAPPPPSYETRVLCGMMTEQATQIVNARINLLATQEALVASQASVQQLSEQAIADRDRIAQLTAQIADHRVKIAQLEAKAEPAEPSTNTNEVVDLDPRRKNRLKEKA